VNTELLIIIILGLYHVLEGNLYIRHMLLLLILTTTFLDSIVMGPREVKWFKSHVATTLQSLFFLHSFIQLVFIKPL
jgi:hypothetical protein